MSAPHGGARSAKRRRESDDDGDGVDVCDLMDTEVTHEQGACNVWLRPMLELMGTFLPCVLP